MYSWSVGRPITEATWLDRLMWHLYDQDRWLITLRNTFTSQFSSMRVKR